MRALIFSAALVSAALSGCVRCCIPLNAPPYDASQWGWGPQQQFYVTRSYVGFAKDYPGTRPYRMSPPGAPPCLTAGRLPGAWCGPPMGPWAMQAGMAGPNAVVVDGSPMPNGMAQNMPSVRGSGGLEMSGTGAFTPNGIVFPIGMPAPTNPGAPIAAAF